MKDLEGRGSDYRWTILVVSLLAQISTGTTTQGVPTLSAFFQVDMSLSMAEVGILNSASGLGLAISLMAAGWIADLVGSRRVILVGLVGVSASLAAVSLGHTYVQVGLLMVLAGVFTGVVSPAVARGIVIWFPRRDRGFATAVQRTGVPLAGVLSAATLPSIALVAGWRAAMVALAALAIAGSLVVFPWYRDNPSPGPSPAAVISRPGSPWKLFRNRDIMLASVLPVALVAVQTSLLTYLVIFLRDTLATPVVVAGGALAVAQMGSVCGRLLWGVVSDRLFRGGRRDVMLLIGALSFLLLGAMGFLPSGMPFWVVTLLVAMLGVLALGWNAVYTVFMPELAGKELAGSAVGLGFTLLQIGTVGGPPLFGYIVDVTGAYRWGWWALALAVAVGTALLTLVREARRR